MSRSRRLAARRAVTRVTPGKGGHQDQRVGQGGPVAVLGPDRDRGTSTAPDRCRPGAGPSPGRASRGPCPPSARWCWRAQAGPPVPTLATWISSTSSKRGRGLGGQDAGQPGREGGAHHDRHPSLAGLGVEIEQPLDVADRVGGRHHRLAAGHEPAGQVGMGRRPVRPAPPRRPRPARRRAPGRSTAPSPSERTIVSSRSVRSSRSTTCSTPSVDTSWRATRAPTAPTPSTATLVMAARSRVEVTRRDHGRDQS